MIPNSIGIASVSASAYSSPHQTGEGLAQKKKAAFEEGKSNFTNNNISPSDAKVNEYS